jgi:hypothetical protein
MMCRIYKANSGWFVRLCYYHQYRRGEHVPVPEGYEMQGQHYPRSGGRATGTSRREYTLSFSVTSFTNQAVVDDMARYAGARANWDKGHETVTLFSEKGWKNARPVVERAATFGWRAI